MNTRSTDVANSGRLSRFIRRNTPRVLAAGIGVAALLAAAGCSGIPTPQQINDGYANRRANLEIHRTLQLASCGTAPNPAGCMSEVDAWYRQKLRELNDAQNLALDQNWDEARKASQKWDDAMREKFKEIGLPSIKDFLKSGTITSNITLTPHHVEPQRGAASGQGGSTSTGSGGVYYEPPCIYETVSVSGGVTADSGDSVYSTHVSGSMVVCWDTMAEPGTLRGQIISADLGLWSTYPPVTLTLDTTSVRTIEANEAGGGRIQAWFKISIPFTPWAAVARDSIYLDLPLTYSSENGFALALNQTPVDSLVPRYRSPLSDFNHDGVYNFTSDLAAFMSAFNAHDLRADRNADGVWNQLDIDIWNEEFARDSAP